MTNNPLLSIIVPVFQVEKYIDTCLSSLCEQSYKNIEIIIINDGSTDNSLEKCKKWQKKDSRIVIKSTKNFGVSHARNMGIDMARGEIITFVDPDDWVESNTYEQLIDEMIISEADVVCGGFCQDSTSETKVVLKKGKKEKINAYNALCEMYNLEFTDKLFGWEMWDKIFRRDIIGQVRLDENISIGEDQLLVWNVMKNVDVFVFIPRYGYHYRLNDAGAMHSMNAKKMFTYITALRMIYNDLYYTEMKNGLLKEKILDIYITAVVRLLKKIIKEREYTLLRSTMNDCQEIIKCGLKPFTNNRLTNNVRLGYLVLYLFLHITGKYKG